MSNQIQEIKNKIDLVELINSYIKLEKSGINFRALCPFHSEKTPSFFVSPARQIWHCFGCGRGGDHFKFVQEIEGVEFSDALKILAERAGIKLIREDPRLRTQRQEIYQILELATKFFEANLKPKNAPYQYLLERGLTPGTIQSFRLGYALPQWEGLLNFFKAKGFNPASLEKAGLVVVREDPQVRGLVKYYDRFRQRIIFPIFDIQGRVIGFSGRIFAEAKDETGKYINTPNTLVYDKSRVLYGLDRAKLKIREKDEVILVEGQMDLLLSHQAGLTNTVATSGSALTAWHLNILKRYSQNLIVAFDADQAGQAATRRTINLALGQGFNVGVVILTGGKDPADLIKQDPTKWQRLVESSRPIMDYYFETILNQFDLKTLAGKKAAAFNFLIEVKKLTNSIEQAYWLNQLSQKLNIKEEALVAELKKIKSDTLPTSEPTPDFLKSFSRKTKLELLGERLLSLILANQEYKMLITDLANPFSEVNTQLAALFDCIKNNKKPTDQPVAELANLLLFQEEIIPTPKEKIESEIKTCLREIQIYQLRQDLEKTAQDIKKAEQTNDLNTLPALLSRFNKISQRLGQLLRSNYDQIEK